MLSPDSVSDRFLLSKSMNHLRHTFLAAMLTAASVAGSFPLRAQTPFSGTFNLSGGGNDVLAFPYNGAPIGNVTVSDLVKSGNSTSSTGNFRRNNWPLGATNGSNTFNGTIDLSKFIEFSLTAEDDFLLDLTSITFGIGRSGTGPRQWEWRSSVDAFAAPITAFSTINSGLSLHSGIITNPDENSSWTGNVLDLSGASFQNLPTITFRLYGYNAEGTAGTGGLQGNLSFAGTVKPGGLFTGATWTGTGGGGIWQAGETGQFESPYNNNLDQAVRFEGLGETVTVIGLVQASTLEILSDGYLLSSGTIELGEGKITVASGMQATIASVLAGEAGLTKLGSGELILTGANTFNGTVNLGVGTLRASGDESFGNPNNALEFAGGRLDLTDDLILSSSRGVSGSGTIFIPAGKTLTSAGNFSMSGLTLAGSGVLHLSGSSQGVGSLSVLQPAVLQGADYVALTGLHASGLNGTFSVNSDLDLSGGGNRVFDVGPNAIVALNGADIFSGARLQKNGAGILQLNGNNTSLFGVSIGLAGGANGGTVQVATDTGLGSALQLFLNHGTLEAIGDRVFPGGVSLGGRNATPAFLAGGNMTFHGNLSFFNDTSGFSRMDVSNTTTFNGTIAQGNLLATTGVLFGGNGRLLMNGDGSAMTRRTVIREALEFVVNNLWGGDISVEQAAVLLGTGNITASLLGNGTVSPGLAGPGILTANSVNGTLGLDFRFGLEQIGPVDLSDPATSPNSLLRLTSATPFSQALDLNNTIRLFIAAETLLETSTYLGGFFTANDSFHSIQGANFEYFVLGDGFGVAASYNGDGYYSLAQFNALHNTNWAFAFSTQLLTDVDFTGNGDALVDGYITTFTVVPEPSTWALLVCGLSLLLLRKHRRGLRG